MDEEGKEGTYYIRIVWFAVTKLKGKKTLGIDNISAERIKVVGDTLTAMSSAGDILWFKKCVLIIIAKNTSARKCK